MFMYYINLTLPRKSGACQSGEGAIVRLSKPTRRAWEMTLSHRHRTHGQTCSRLITDRDFSLYETKEPSCCFGNMTNPTRFGCAPTFQVLDADQVTALGYGETGYVPPEEKR
jgi:hypothetical protein